MWLAGFRFEPGKKSKPWIQAARNDKYIDGVIDSLVRCWYAANDCVWLNFVLVEEGLHACPVPLDQVGGTGGVDALGHGQGDQRLAHDERVRRRDQSESED